MLAPLPRLTVRGLKLRHGGHEGVLGHVTLKLLHDWLLVSVVQLLLELHWLESCEPAPHVVEDGDILRLRGGETCGTE